MRAAKGRRWHGTALTVQASQVEPARAAEDVAGQDLARIGFTLTRKVGCAVVRNRARRRLKEAVRLSPDLPVAAGRDYVIIGRAAALRLPFEALQRELAQAVRGATQAGRRKPAPHTMKPEP